MRFTYEAIHTDVRRGDWVFFLCGWLLCVFSCSTFAPARRPVCGSSTSASTLLLLLLLQRDPRFDGSSAFGIERGIWRGIACRGGVGRGWARALFAGARDILRCSFFGRNHRRNSCFFCRRGCSGFGVFFKVGFVILDGCVNGDGWRFCFHRRDGSHRFGRLGLRCGYWLHLSGWVQRRGLIASRSRSRRTRRVRLGTLCTRTRTRTS